MHITVAGYGTVGKAHASVLTNNHIVHISDPKLRLMDEAFRGINGVIICVDTPQNSNGDCDVSNILAVLEKVHPITPVLIKSTVSLEGWRLINSTYPIHQITFSPEFLRDETAEEDLKNTKDLYLGESGDWTFWSNLLCDSLPFVKDIHVKPVEELILAKYFRNAYLATKVTFFNQIHDLCARTGTDFETVRKVVADDERIGSSHTFVTDDRGYGGKCFLKDVAALLNTAEEVGTTLSLVQVAQEYNTRIKITQKLIDKSDKTK